MTMCLDIFKSLPRFDHLVRHVSGDQWSKQLGEPPRPELHVVSCLDSLNGPPSVIENDADFDDLQAAMVESETWRTCDEEPLVLPVPDASEGKNRSAAPNPRSKLDFA